MSSEKPRKQRGGGHQGGGPMGMAPGEKAKDFKGSIKKLAAYLTPYKWSLVMVAILAALASVFAIAGPKIMALAVDELAAGFMNMMKSGAMSVDFGYIGKVVIILILLYVFSSLFGYIQGYVMANISTKVSYSLRGAIMSKINKLPLAYFHKTSQGDVLSRITNDVDAMEQSLSQSVTQLISSIATLVGVGIMMLTISWQLTLVALGVVPLSLILVMTLVKLSQKHFVNQQKYLGTVNGQVEENYGGHVVVKVFGGEEQALQQFQSENEKLVQSARKAEFLSGLMMPVMMFVGNLGYVVVCIIGASMASGGRISIGDIQAFIQYVRSFTQPITQLANISNQFQRLAAASERIFEFLGEEEEQEGAVTKAMHELEIEGQITFQNARFGYDSSKIVIQDFSVNIQPGQKVAIVGPTGAGKTTIVKLLMRYHDLDSGAIFVDGHNISEFTRQDLRTKFGMVLQDTWLFNGSIMENIRYGNLEASDASVIEAAKKAQVDFFVRTLPGGYQTELNEETSNISQGQKQLLTIARAILADPRVLILDEATSSVDTRTEILIQKAMDKLMSGRTSFIIAHRLSTIRNADMILCMKDGDIVEQGTHEELLEKDGFYANLYNSQFEDLSEEVS